MEINKIIKQLQEIADDLNEIGNATLYKGPIIDASLDVKLAIRHLERHARNEKARAKV